MERRTGILDCVWGAQHRVLWDTVTVTQGTSPHNNEASPVQYFELVCKIPLCNNVREGDIENVNGFWD